MADQKGKAQFVAVDEQTAAELKEMAQKANMSVVQLMKNMSKLFKYSMGRRVRVESSQEEKYASFDYEKYRKLIDIDAEE